MTAKPFSSYLTWLEEECGYQDVRVLDDGRWAALGRYAFTCAILVGQMGDFGSFDDRWCYHSMSSAREALGNWDGTGEPAGWHRHPASGRRISETGEEVSDDAKKVGAIGAMYVRR